MFATREVADNWWRAVTDSVASGYDRFADIKRVSPHFYTHDPYKGNIQQTTVDSNCASNFSGKVIFTLLNDDTGRVINMVPMVNYTDHLSGRRYVLRVHFVIDSFLWSTRYYIRSAVSPTTFWYYDASNKVVVASQHKRTKFIVHLGDDARPRGTVIVGSDDVFLALDPNTKIVVVNRDGVDRLGPGQRPFRFRFSDFNGGFGIEYDFEGSGGDAIARSPTVGDGERWELAA